ncbi:MAG: hypothetical protein M3512_17410, partial [Bacteroidota bacterium]|nr:hypothetical protein [Bacteroidota bacterium]
LPSTEIKPCPGAHPCRSLPWFFMSCFLLPPLPLAHPGSRTKTRPTAKAPGKSQNPAHKAKSPARKNRPKLYLHNTSYISPGLFQRPKGSDAGLYNWVLCKIAARPALPKGKKPFPFNPFRAVFFASNCPLPAKNTARRAGHKCALLVPLKQGAWPQA